MKTTILFLFSFVAATAQTTQTCFFPMIVQTTPQYFRLTSLNPLQCEDVTLDSTVLAVRNSANNVIISSLAGSAAPPHNYTTPLQWTLISSNSAYQDPAPPASPFNGQTIWCFSTSIAAFTTWGSQLNQFVPTALVEVRTRTNPAPGEFPQVLTTGVTAATVSPSSGGRFLWIKAAPACNGIPGVVWTSAAGSIGIDASTVSTTLGTAFVVGIL